MENRKIAGLVLIIVGIVMIFMGINFIIDVTCIIGGIYFSMYPRPIPGQRSNIELVKKRSKIRFIVGTIFIGIYCLVIYWDSVIKPYGSLSGAPSLLVSPVYFFGLYLVIYSIRLIGNKWGWLDFPIAIVIFVVALNQMAYSLELAYRLAWFLVFPLNYVALLILFLATSIKNRQINDEDLTKILKRI